MLSRRALLAGGSTATAMALAGCVSGFESDEENGNGDPEAGNGDDWEPSAAVSDWMAASVVDDDASMWVEKPAQLATVDGLEYESEILVELATVDDEEVELLADIDETVFVFAGTFAGEGILDQLRADMDEDIEQDGERGEFDIYTGLQAAEEGIEPTVGVTEGAVVAAAGREPLEATIDVTRGEAPLFAEQNPQFDRLNETFADHPFRILSLASTTDYERIGSGYRFVDGTAQLSVVSHHTDGDAASAFGDRIAEIADDSPLTSGGISLDAVDIELEGPDVHVTATQPVEAFDQGAPVGALLEMLDPGESPRAPQVAFDFDYRPNEGDESGTLTVTHVAGDAFDADQVQFDGSGFAGVGSAWHEQADGKGPDDSVMAGDRAELEVFDPEFAVDLVWTAEDGHSSAILGSTTGPDH